MKLNIKLTSITNPEIFMELIENATSHIYMIAPKNEMKKNNATQSHNLILLENNKDTTRFIHNLSIKENPITIIVHTVQDYYSFLNYSMFGY